MPFFLTILGKNVSIPVMRNITSEVPAPLIKARYPDAPLPPRGVDDCVCQQRAPRSEFMWIWLGATLLAAAAQGPLNKPPEHDWYARKTCPIHGLTIKDPSA